MVHWDVFRLAWRPGSLALGLTMHLLVVMDMVHRWRLACCRGPEQRAAAYARSLERIAREGIVMAAVASEPN
jgi:hypothetical protein